MENREKEQAKDFNSLFQQLKTDALSYIDHRLYYYRLDFLEKIGKYASLLALGLMIAFVALAAFAFAMIGAALYIGELLGNAAAGFAVVAFFWLVLLIIILLIREPIKCLFLNRTIRVLYKIEKEGDEDEEK